MRKKLRPEFPHRCIFRVAYGELLQMRKMSRTAKAYRVCDGYHELAKASDHRNSMLEADFDRGRMK